MRIIAGQYRRRNLSAPEGHLTRPTADRTREAIFNLIQHRMPPEGADVLDLFAGTGALGLEALSRGADVVTFVESNPAVLAFARRNAEALGVEDHCVFLRVDALAYLRDYHGPAFDLVLADPPYELEGLPTLPDLVLPLLKDDGLFVLEHDRRHAFDDHPRLDTSRPYGRTLVSVFTAAPRDAPGE